LTRPPRRTRRERPFAHTSNRLVTRPHPQSTRFTALERRPVVIDKRKARPGWFPLALVVACGLLFIGLGIMLEAKE